MMEIDVYKTWVFLPTLEWTVFTSQLQLPKQNPELTAVTSTPPHNGYSYTGWLNNGNTIIDGHLLSSVDKPLFLPSVVIPEPPQC